MRIIDLHEDIAYFLQRGSREMIRDFDRDIEGRHGDIPKYKRSGVGLVFSAIFPALETWDPIKAERLGRLYGRAADLLSPIFLGMSIVWEQAKIYYRLEEIYRDHIKIIRSKSDLENFLSSDKIMLLISLEGSDSLTEPYDLHLLYRLGVRSIAITWNYSNKYGSSCMSRRDYGLTDEGEELVREANELGVILDVSHASKRTALDVAEISKEPIIASHSNYSGIIKHPRNIDDDVLEIIKKKGGVVGFTLIRSTIGGEESLKDLARHIIEVKERYGSDVIAIGTDYFGISKTPEGLDNISKIPDLFKYLADKGFSENDLRKLAYENALRVIMRNAEKWR